MNRLRLAAFGRPARFVATVIIVTMLTSIILDLVPGNTAAFLAGENATPEVVDAVAKQYGLNDPVYIRYLHWIGGVLQGDLGSSFVTKQPVAEAIWQRLPVTLELALLATILSFAVAVPLAMFCSLRAGGRFDRLCLNVTTAMTSVPAFVLAILFVLVFALRLGWFPVLGWIPLSEDPSGNLRNAILPVLTIFFAEMAVVFRVLRADVIGTLEQDFVALARAKGLSTRRIMTRHVLRPSSFSLITVAGIQFARALGGTVIVESVFVLPGVGSLLISSVGDRDLITLQGIVLFLAFIFLVANLTVDMMYGLLDPRSRVRS
ncbi:peptide ABC transporter [Nocardioides sp. Root190]|uniref:ABC transporter permease n=1 Tax=Nocardioides sp. Root190 TaxID=1736488 RepID=UPI0006FFE797|nr:ABC transporter permease [Nocardioides sp. Root190]KRB75089.1 peptide ABC transporter [Nocardioides sp. Root190]